MAAFDAIDDGDMDLGLVSRNDESGIFVNTPDRPTRQLPCPGGRHPSSSFISSSTHDLQERQDRIRPQRLSLHQLTRSQTLPRSILRSPVRERSTSTLDASLEPDVVERLRRWILCVLVGEHMLSVFFFHHRSFYRFTFAVNFDLDLGPVVEGVCPHLALSASEKENM